MGLLLLPCASVLATADTPAIVAATQSTPFDFTRPVHFHLERQPLPQALTRFAEQAGLQMLYRTQAIPTLEVGPLEGDMPPEQAIKQLLAGSQLDFAFGGKGAVVILPLPEPPAAVTPEPPAARPPESPTEELQVTGIRNSLARSLEIKQARAEQVDAINAEDVGKFPDKNVADALQRIPGVSVDRIWGEGRDINIRGTDKDINRTLMNGQNVASAYWWANDNPSRGFNYTILASELIASLAVYKSPSADIDEGSIGGTVIIYTHKPFEMKSGQYHLNLETQYSQLADAWDPQLAFLGSWKNSEQTLGLLASFNWQNRSARRDGLEAFPDNARYNIVDENGQVTPDVYVIWGGGSAIFQQQRTRRTSNVTLQWAPRDAWEAVFNYVNSDMEMEISNQNYLFMPGGFKLRESPPVRVEQPRFGATGDGHLTLLGGTLDNPDSTGAALDAIFRDAYVRSSVYDLDLKHQGDSWTLHTQLGRTAAEGGSDHDRLYRFLGNTRERFSLARDSIEVSYLDLDPQDPAALNSFSSDSRDWIRQMADSEDYAQLDLERSLAGDWLSGLKLGLKWRDHRIENRRVVGAPDTGNSAWENLAQTGLDQVSSGLTPELHREAATAGSLTRFAWVDENLVARVIDPVLKRGVMQYRYDWQAFYRINEQISAAYAKLDFEHQTWRGNLGLRAVETYQQSSSFTDLSAINAQVADSAQLHSRARVYRDWLPSVNLVYDLGEGLLWRSSMARVMARPTFQNLSDNLVIDGTSSNASSGNPDLQAYRANQLDSGLEWYFDERSIVSATYFYKSISTFIYTRREQALVNGEWISLARPYNAEGAQISGLELQWQQGLGNGFGWVSNYTYTNARVPSADGLQTLKLPGNSRAQINTSVYYETADYALRLFYNYRSKSYGELISGTQDETSAYQQWDFSASWNISSSVTAYLEAINLTNEVIYYRTANQIPQGLYENGRRFSLGLRLGF